MRQALLLGVLLAAAGSIVYSLGGVVTDRRRGYDVTMRRLGVAQPHCRVASITEPTDPHRGDEYNAPPLDSAEETEATSRKHDGKDDPELCGYGVRTSPVSSDADTDSLQEFRVKAAVSSLPSAGASIGGPRSPTPPTANLNWSSDEDEYDNYRGFLEDCSDAVLQHVRRVTNTGCRARVGNEVRACFSALLREVMEPAFLNDIINAFLDKLNAGSMFNH